MKELLSTSIREDIRSQILSGHFQPGERIPSETNIAEKYGVNRMTVRRSVLELISEGLLERVPWKGTFVAETKQINAARALKLENVVAVSLPHMRSSWQSRLLNGIQQPLMRNGFKLLLHCANSDEIEIRKFLSDLPNMGVVGAILLTGDDFKKYVLNAARDIDIVTVHARFENVQFDMVHTDDCKGAYMATSYLIELGHQNIAHFYYYKGMIEQGYLDALKAHGIEFNPSLMRHCNASAEDGYNLTKQLMQVQPETTAILASDLIAEGALRALKEIGIRVPEDVSVVGYGNTDAGALLDVPLTSVEQSPDEMGRIAATLLVEKLTGMRAKEDHREILIEPKLIVRQSCGICIKK